jgi:hypothetical protein
VSNPAIAEAALVSPATIMGTYATGWTTYFGTVSYAPIPLLNTQPVFRVGKRAASTTGLGVCYAALQVEYSGLTDNPWARSGLLLWT